MSPDFSSTCSHALRLPGFTPICSPLPSSWIKYRSRAGTSSGRPVRPLISTRVDRCMWPRGPGRGTEVWGCVIAAIWIRLTSPILDRFPTDRATRLNWSPVVELSRAALTPPMRRAANVHDVLPARLDVIHDGLHADAALFLLVLRRFCAWHRRGVRCHGRARGGLRCGRGRRCRRRLGVRCGRRRRQLDG
eukprot:scaffold15879_cov66-Phaeocystis_antarctica.AAC.4